MWTAPFSLSFLRYFECCYKEKTARNIRVCPNVATYNPVFEHDNGFSIRKRIISSNDNYEH